MNKPAILGVLLLGVAGSVAASCSSDKNNTGPSANASGGTATGDAGTGGGASGGAPADGAATDGPPFACGHADASAQLNEEGGLARIGFTDPARSVALGDGGHYVMSTKYKGYCFTYDDKAGSSVYPPCGTTGPCFTQSTGLCPSASLGEGSTGTWGGGIGCSLNQAAGENTPTLNVDVIGMTSMTISVYGCSVPDELQVQLNAAMPWEDAATQPDGYFCKRVTLSAPDANGIRTGTVQLTDLQMDCWLTGGRMFDPANMLVKSIQAQINAIERLQTNWDFCVSQWSLQ